MNYEINVSTLPSLELAEEVISSAIRILKVAGLTKAEITEFLRQAIDSLDEVSNETEALDDEVHHEREGPISDFEEDRLFDLEQEFDRQDFNKKLTRLSRRGVVLENIDDLSTLEKASNIIFDAIPLRLESIAWLNNRAVELGIEVHPNKDNWVKAVDDEALDKEDKHIFLDDWRWQRPFEWRIVERVANHLATIGAKNALESLYTLVSDSELSIDKDIVEAAEGAWKAATTYNEFISYVSGFSGSGEQMQSEIVDNFSRANSGLRTYYIDKWLCNMADQGVLERYKRAGRWRILVP